MVSSDFSESNESARTRSVQWIPVGQLAMARVANGFNRFRQQSIADPILQKKQNWHLPDQLVKDRDSADRDPDVGSCAELDMNVDT